VKETDFLRALPPERRQAAERALRELNRATGSKPVTQDVDLWVDEDGLVRRMRQVSPLPAQQGAPAGRFDATIEMSDFGAKLDAKAPAAGQVYDATGLITDAIGSGALQQGADGGAAG
jgi:hypothetical protein